MENDFSTNSEFDSCRFCVNVTSLNSDKLQIFWNPAPPLAHRNLPQISCASCQMVLFFSGSLLSFSIRQTLQFNTASSEPQLGISCHPPIKSPISGSHQAHISSLPSDLKGKSPSNFPISHFFLSSTVYSNSLTLFFIISIIYFNSVYPFWFLLVKPFYYSFIKFEKGKRNSPKFSLCFLKFSFCVQTKNQQSSHFLQHFVHKLDCVLFPWIFTAWIYSDVLKTPKVFLRCFI